MLLTLDRVVATAACLAMCALGQPSHAPKSRLRAFRLESAVDGKGARQQIKFDAARNILTVEGAANYSVDVNHAAVTPEGQLAISGTVRDSAGGQVGAGSVFALTASFTTTNGQASFSAMTASVGGVGAFTSATGTGTVVLGGDAQPVAVAGPKGAQSYSPVFFLDGSQSWDPGHRALKYSWSFVSAAGQSASIQFANTPYPLVTIDTNDFAYGDYVFQLTVTNSAGVSNTDTVDIMYLSPDDVVINN